MTSADISGILSIDFERKTGALMNTNGIVSFEDFIATGRDMKAREFGRMISDSQWDGPENEDTVFRVYQDTYFIEHLSSGASLLVIGNGEWIANDVVSVRDLEYRLWKYALSESAHGCLHDLRAKEASGKLTEQDRLIVRLLTVLVDEQDVEVFDSLVAKLSRFAIVRKEEAAGPVSSD